jgi:MtN3 and saliva related transmembrane protein
MDFVSIVGFMAATISTAGFLPQTIKTVKSKQAKDVSLWMYIILAVGVTLWFIYGIYKHDWPIILANGITITFVIPVLWIKIRYK